MPRPKALPPVNYSPEALARLVFGESAKTLDESSDSGYKNNEPSLGLDPSDGSRSRLMEGREGEGQ